MCTSIRSPLPHGVSSLYITPSLPPPPPFLPHAVLDPGQQPPRFRQGPQASLLPLRPYSSLTDRQEAFFPLRHPFSFLLHCSILTLAVAFWEPVLLVPYHSLPPSHPPSLPASRPPPGH